jgi:hypothetical protein
MTVTFKAPFGTAEQHVISAAQHFGYRYLVAYLVDGGCAKDYIIRACAEALDVGAPKDAVCHQNGQWKRRSQMGVTLGRRLDSYTAALTRYEQELKAERRQEGS